MTFVVATSAPRLARAAPLADDTIATDRPSNCFASTTVKQFMFQVETSVGLHYNKVGNAKATALTLPTSLRFGVFDWLELRIDGELLGVLFRTGEDTHVGFNDLAFGFKLQLIGENSGAIPTLALIAQLHTPTGTDPLTSDSVTPRFLLSPSWALGAGFSLNLNIGADVPEGTRPGDGDSLRYVQFLQVTNVGYKLPVWRERVGVFVEGTFRVPARSGFKSQASFDFGFTLLLTPNQQLDAQVFVGLTEATEDLQVGLGYSFRT